MEAEASTCPADNMRELGGLFLGRTVPVFRHHHCGLRLRCYGGCQSPTVAVNELFMQQSPCPVEPRCDLAHERFQ